MEAPLLKDLAATAKLDRIKDLDRTDPFPEWLEKGLEALNLKNWSGKLIFGSDCGSFNNYDGSQQSAGRQILGLLRLARARPAPATTLWRLATSPRKRRQFQHRFQSPQRTRFSVEVSWFSNNRNCKLWLLWRNQFIYFVKTPIGIAILKESESAQNLVAERRWRKY